MISSKNLNELGDIGSLRKLLKSLATLDLIMSPEWESRYYSFNSQWDKGEELGSMRNGMGDEFFVWFNKAGCFIKGFDHESAISSWSTQGQSLWPNIYQGVPTQLSAALKEPAFAIENVSFAFWRLREDPSWSRSDFPLPESEDPDGSEYLLEILNGKPSTYQDFAEEYYEEDIPLAPIRDIYAHAPITTKTIEYLNPCITIEDIAEELVEIGYPEEL
ncbi:hypothetical protein EYS14_01295 [Alteromonadaceae bacterium M269]|nr:hypothetical protein EYS14_01295 [Alteromonadaceae bacterium M269]